MRRVAFALFVALLLAGTPSTALAALVIDQANASGNIVYVGPSIQAQTFEPAMPGYLERVDLQLEEDTAGGHTVTVEIKAQSRTTGLPTGNPLATSTAHVDVRAWYPFVFSKPAKVLAGAHLAIVITMDSGGRTIGSDDTYAHGELLHWLAGTWKAMPSHDLTFMTYMSSTPPPTPTPKKPVKTATAGPTQAPTGTPSAAPTGSPAVSMALTPTPSGSEITPASMAATADPGGSSSPGSGSGGADWAVIVFGGVAVLAAVIVAFALGRRR